MSQPKSSAANSRRSRNSPAVPIILTVIIGGALLGARWVNEVAAAHEVQRLESQERTLVDEIDKFKIDIIDQQGRIRELAVRDRVFTDLPKHHVRMVDVRNDSVILIKAPVPQNDSVLVAVPPQQP
jgi:hypothetical protein